LRIINLIQKPQLRGAEIFACQLSNHLMELGHEVLIVSIFKGDSQLPFNGEIILLDRPLSYRFIDIMGWRKFNVLINEFNPDIIQANAADTLKFAVSSKLLFSWDYPIIFRNANKMGDFINSKIKWKLNNFYLSKVSYVISVSEECEKDLVKTFQFPKNKIQTVEIGVEKKNLGDYPSDLKTIFNYGPVISHIGGFVPEKNHEELINIFKNILLKFPEAQLLLMGKGKLEERVKGIVYNLGIGNNVHFLGYRNDVLNILHHSDVFVLPSLIEGLPAVILEAMYCNTPVIAYNVGGISEIVISKKTGWLIEKNDVQSFEKALMNIFREDENINSIIIEAKRMVTERFSNDTITDRFLECYNNISNKPDARPKAKMKILQLVTRRQYRGAELFAADLSSELIKLGHEVVFVGIYENDKDILSVDNADNRDLVSAKNSLFSLRIVKKIVELVKEIKPDIIQCNGSDTLKYTVSASYFFNNVPLVYRNISIISEWINGEPKKIIYKKIFKRITYVTSVGDESLEDFIKTYDYPRANAKVIRRGIPMKSVDGHGLSHQLRIDMGFDEKAKIAIHIGNFSQEKNHEFLLDVFDKLKNEYPNIKLICIGSGILYEEFKESIIQRGLEKSVFQLGFRKDIPELLAASDCLVLCSKIEGVPGVILEAGVQKIPSVATNVGGVSEVLIDGKTGYLINDFNREDFKDKLVQILQNDEKRIAFGQNAYNMISNGFDPKKNAARFEKLYLDLIESKKRERN
jgi:glycosyltransferase involved in cell wall biosynthesis